MSFWTNPFSRSAATPLQVAVSQEREQRSVSVSTDEENAGVISKVFGGYATGAPAVTQESALGMAAVWACVQAISQDIAALPLPLYRDTDQGKEKLGDHPAAYLLNVQANPMQLAFTFRQALLATALLWGNGYARIEWNSRMQPVGLHYKHPRNTEVFEREGRLFYRFAGDKTIYQDYDVIHLKGLSLDGKMGLSVLHVHRETVGQGLAAKRTSANFYKRGAQLSGVLETEAQFKDANVARRLSQGFTELYGGSDNAGRVAVLEGGMTYKSISLPPKDAQYIETAGLTLSDVARIFRVPPHKIGDLSRSTNNNIESQGIDYVQSTLQPWLVNQEQEFRIKLLSRREVVTSYFRHTLSALLRADAAARGAFYTQLFQAGAISPNQIMALEEMNPIIGGDRHFVQLNLQPLDRVDDTLNAQQAPAAKTLDNENSPEA